jgi:S1-C subfamily serine protease
MKVLRPLLIALTAVIMLWCSFWLYGSFISAKKKTVPGDVLAESHNSQLLPEEKRRIEIYHSASQAVVNITTMVLSYDYFQNPVPTQGSGSGVILSKDGYILTNNHVVEGARKLVVTLLNGKTMPGKLIGRDPGSDIALIKLEGSEPLPFVTMGDSAHLEVGESVYAIGNPFGFNSTLTTGVISSLNRTLREPNGRLIENVIQTDAAINPGNSGGALLNSSGELIGINTAIFSPTGSFAGIGFAIPVHKAKRIVDDLIRYGKVIRPYLGTSIGIEITPRVAQALNLPTDHGVMVGEVSAGSPAAEAGIQAGTQKVLVGNRELYLGGDIIVEADKHPVTSADEFVSYIESKNPGDKLELKILRDGKTMEKSVVLKERPENL